MENIKKRIEKLSKSKKENLLKTIIVFITYLLYTTVVFGICKLFRINNDIIINFIGDILFLVFVLFLYKDKISSDRDVFNNIKPLKSRILKVVYWVLIIFAANFLGGCIFSLMATTNNYQTGNNIALMSLPYMYKFFKTIIFSSIAEEIVVKQSIRDIVDNNILFIILSTLIYSCMNIAYTNLSGMSLLLNILPYTIFAIITGLMYIKYKNNIYMVMIVKIIYTFIPFVVMLIEVGA